MSSSTYRQHLERFLKTLDVKAQRVIDVGGRSNPVFLRVKSWAVSDVYAVLDNDLEDAHPQLTREGANFWPHDLNLPFDETKHNPMKVDPYDMVFCLEVFDYIWNPVQAIANLRRLCKEGSKLIITFPFIYPNHNPAKFDMLRYTKFGAAKLLRHGGFAIEDIIPRLMNHTGEWKTFCDFEGYRSRGAMEVGTMFDAGYIFICHAK